MRRYSSSRSLSARPWGTRASVEAMRGGRLAEPELPGLPGHLVVERLPVHAVAGGVPADPRMSWRSVDQSHELRMRHALVVRSRLEVEIRVGARHPVARGRRAAPRDDPDGVQPRLV